MNEQENYKRENVQKNEQIKLMQREYMEFKDEAMMLREKIQMLESDKINLMSEKERRERDFRNMQQELSRLNTYVANIKNNEESQY